MPAAPHGPPPVFSAEAFRALERAIDEPPADAAARREQIEAAGSDFVRHALQPLIEGCVWRVDCARRGGALRCPPAELVAKGRLFRQRLDSASYVVSSEFEEALRTLGLFDRAYKANGADVTFPKAFVDAVEDVVEEMAHALAEHPARCLAHVLRGAYVEVAVEQGASIDAVRLAREAVQDYFATQQCAFEMLGALVEESKKLPPGEAFRLNFEDCAMDPALDGWLYRPSIDTGTGPLSIVVMLCNSVYASLQSSLVRVGEHDLLALSSAEGRASEMTATCRVLVAAVSEHVWCAEDLPLLHDHGLIALFDELCQYALSEVDEPANQAAQTSGPVSAHTQQQCKVCAVMLGAVLTELLPNIEAHLHPAASARVSADNVQHGRQAGQALQELAETIIAGQAEPQLSGAKAHLLLLIACGQAQRGAAGGDGLHFSRGLSKGTRQRGLINIVQLLQASMAVPGGGAASTNPFVVATLGVWGGMLHVLRSAAPMHQPAADITSANVVVYADGRASWPVIEATSMLCEAQPQRAVALFAAWQLHHQLSAWTSEALALAAQSCTRGAGATVGSADSSAKRGLAVRDAAAMQGVMLAGHAVVSLCSNVFKALRTCAEEPSAEAGASQAWGMARELFVLLQDVLAPLQSSPAVIVDNLEGYASCLAAFTAVAPTPSDARGAGGYVVSHLTSKVLGSRIGHSGGGCFRQGGRVEGGGGDGAQEAAYEASLVQFHVWALGLVRQMVYWAMQFEPGKDIDSAHPLGQYALPGILQALMRLWAQPLPGVLKAEIVRVLCSLIHRAPLSPDPISSGTVLGTGTGDQAHAAFVANVLDSFVTSCLIEPVSLREPTREGGGRAGGGMDGGFVAGDRAPSALMYELSLLDRTRGQYEHTLAVLALLSALTQPTAQALTPDEALRLLDMVLPLLPSTCSATIDEVFNIPCQRWQVTEAVFEWASLLLARVMPPPGSGQKVSEEGMRVLSWLLQNSGQLGDMQDSDSVRGLYVSAVDLIALGMTYSSAIIATSADDTTLKYLSQCVASAIKLVSLAIEAAGGTGDWINDGAGGQSAAWELAADLRESVLDVLCGGWTTSPLEMHRGVERVRALSSLLKYAALANNEPSKLSAHALRLIILLCKSAVRNSELVDAFLYDCTEEDRDKITRGLAGWLEQSLAMPQPSRAGEGEWAACDVAAEVLRVLVRSLDTLHDVAGQNACDPRDVVCNPAQYGENLAVALLGLRQVSLSVVLLCVCVCICVCIICIFWCVCVYMYACIYLYILYA